MTHAQPSLLDALARNTDPDTSHAAAVSQTPAKLSAGRLLALRTLAEHGPLTDFELAEITGRQQTSVGKRRCELVRAGLAADTGQRRLFPSGSPAIVWALTIEGRQAAALHT